MKRLVTTLLIAVIAVGGLVACGSSAKAGTCLSSLGGRSAAAEKGSVPNMAVGCLDGSGDVTIPALNTPMIISFWAQYCPPCRTELPALERFAQANAGTVTVIGVDTADVASMGRSMASDMDLTFPMLFDPKSTLYRAVAAPGLPTLLFVAPGGHIVHSLSSDSIDEATITKMASTYLGVTAG
jgi:thiol-disulfide isomerase/thioredoxin